MIRPIGSARAAIGLAFVHWERATTPEAAGAAGPETVGDDRTGSGVLAVGFGAGHDGPGKEALFWPLEQPASKPAMPEAIPSRTNSLL